MSTSLKIRILSADSSKKKKNYECSFLSLVLIVIARETIRQSLWDGGNTCLEILFLNKTYNIYEYILNQIYTNCKTDIIQDLSKPKNKQI